MHCDVKGLIKCMRVGGIVCFPTDTVYAIASSANAIDAIKRIYRLKQRALNKPLSIFLPNCEEIMHYAIVDSVQYNFICSNMPGPITCVMKKQASCHFSWLSGDKIGIRIPTNNIARTIIEECGFSIVATSANISGSSEMPGCYKKISKCIIQGVDGAIEYDEEVSGIHSTVIDLTVRPFQTIRDAGMRGNL